MKIPFQKLQGLGNDFIIFVEEDVSSFDYSQLARKVCNRNFGIGADGMMVLKNSTPIEMIFFNQDGSEAPMCGNGLRCFSRFAYQQGFVDSGSFKVNTKGGLMEVSIDENDMSMVEVNLGKAKFNTSDIPSIYPKNTFIDQTIEIDGLNIGISALFMGTSHSVVFVDDIGRIDIERLGSMIENSYLFPKKINANFCKVISKDEIEVSTWERGVGKTLACGTGACASVVISNKLGYTSDRVRVKLAGGELIIRIQDEEVHMKGKASLIADGYYYL